MEFVSTRSPDIKVELSTAIIKGLADDGGLFVPVSLPKLSMDDFSDAKTWQDVAIRFLKPFFEGDRLERFLPDIVKSAFNFPLPLSSLAGSTEILELYHGSTGAFKDVGARFLARCFDALGEQRMILVATSGDTGSAVASAFHGLPNTSVSVFFPKGKISPFQERQLTCWGDNILSVRVRGDFDACQQLVKSLFLDRELSEKYAFSSANSINLGRLLPQCTYYAYASLDYYRRHGTPASFVVPTGNMGNSLACIWAREMGLPISRIVLATNENDPIPQYFRTGKFEPKPSKRTLANAMDVGNPSNMERFLYSPSTDISAVSISDEKIKQTIVETYNKYGVIIDPHTATAVSAWNGQQGAWVLVSTAHPSKFHEIVEPLIDKSLDFPPQLKEVFEKPVSFVEIDPTIESFVKELEKFVSKL